MKILMIRWNSIVEPDVIDAFKTQGHEIIIYNHTISDVDYDKDTLIALSNNLQKETFDAVFSIDFFPIIARICNLCKIRYISWSVDCPVLQYYSNTLELPYNRIFLFDKAMYEEFLPKNENNIFYLPLATNIAHNNEVISKINEQDRKQFTSDISFIGSTYSEKCIYNKIEGKLSPWTKGMAEGLIDAQQQVYGSFILKDACSDRFLNQFLKEIDFSFTNKDYDYDVATFVSQFFLGEKVTEQERLRLLKFLSDRFSVDIYTMSDVSKIPNIHNKGPAESRIEMPKIFHLSKINLNITSKTIQTGLPQRFWDVLGAGGFLLTNYQTELCDFFDLGIDIETYGSFEECADKIRYFLKHDSKRKKIALNGYKKVCDYYTYEHRIRQMEDILIQRDNCQRII